MINPELHKKPMALDRVAHRNLKIRRDQSALDGAAGLNAFFVTFAEFADACKEYPILFLRAGQDDQGRDLVAPVTVFGIQKGENLVYRHGSQAPAPLVPDQVYEIYLPLQATAYRLRSGHRLRLLLAAADFQNYWPTPLPHTLTLHVGPGHPSRVVLPLAGAPDPTLPEPRFLPSDFPPTPPEEMNRPQYHVVHDLVADALEVQIITRSGCGVNYSRYRVHRRNPAFTAIDSSYTYPLKRPDFEAKVQARSKTYSDIDGFRHHVEVEITLDDEPYWKQEWFYDGAGRADLGDTPTGEVRLATEEDRRKLHAAWTEQGPGNKEQGSGN